MHLLCIIFFLKCAKLYLSRSEILANCASKFWKIFRYSANFQLRFSYHRSSFNSRDRQDAYLLIFLNRTELYPNSKCRRTSRNTLCNFIRSLICPWWSLIGGLPPPPNKRVINRVSRDHKFLETKIRWNSWKIGFCKFLCIGSLKKFWGSFEPRGIRQPPPVNLWKFFWGEGIPYSLVKSACVPTYRSEYLWSSEFYVAVYRFCCRMDSYGR